MPTAMPADDGNTWTPEMALFQRARLFRSHCLAVIIKKPCSAADISSSHQKQFNLPFFSVIDLSIKGLFNHALVVQSSVQQLFSLKGTHSVILRRVDTCCRRKRSPHSQDGHIMGRLAKDYESSLLLTQTVRISCVQSASIIMIAYYNTAVASQQSVPCSAGATINWAKQQLKPYRWVV